MPKIHSDDTVWLTDLGLVATLRLSFPLVDMDAHDSTRIAFGFSNQPEVQEFIEQYWKKELQVEPQAFYSQLLMTRKQINQSTIK